MAQDSSNDPYRPPANDEVEPNPVGMPLHHAPLATRGERLAARVLDFVLGLGAMLPIMYGLGQLDQPSRAPEASFTPSVTDVASSFAVFVALNGYFLHKHAQTIGKRLIGIRVVNVKSGAPTPFWKLAFVRELPQLLLCLIPFVGIWLSMFELLFIARADLRTGHDLWTSTRVVKVFKT